MSRDFGTFDVAVLGAGNAALCAAITAREAGASVAIVERAPKAFRAGNSRHTRNLRCMHDAPTELLTEIYSEDEFLGDLLRVTENQTDHDLARIVVRGSAGCPEWMRRHGVRFQSSLRGTLHLDRTNAFFLGGGKALMNTYYGVAERLGVQVFYEADVVGSTCPTAGFSPRRSSSTARPPSYGGRRPSWRRVGSNRIWSGCGKPGGQPPTTSLFAGRPTTPARS